MSTTLTIANALKAHLASLALPGGTPGEKLFETVEISLNKNLRDALKKLYQVKNRVALVVPLGDRFEAKQSQAHMAQSTRSIEFEILVADRDYLGGRDAGLGAGVATPGVLEMKDQVLSSFDGVLSWQPLPIVEGTEQYEVADSKDTPGRQFWVIDVRFEIGSSTTAAPTRRV